MFNDSDYFKLGASLYVPATRGDVADVMARKKLEAVRSIIFCTEDSVREDQVPAAMENLARALRFLVKREESLRFVRVRNPEVLRQVLTMPGVESLDGFVLPKVTPDTFPQYVEVLQRSPFGLRTFYLMPTLETVDVFDDERLNTLRQMFQEHQEAVLSIRVGGNDLLHLLGVRRSRHRTIYESPLGPTMSKLVTTFKPYGFNITSPVYESVADREILERELALDLEYGFFGKTAIHPDQVPLIERAYMPSEEEVQAATAILAEDAPAVFKMHGAMCEVATHSHWARQVLIRAKIYGIFGTLKPAA